MEESPQKQKFEDFEQEQFS